MPRKKLKIVKGFYSDPLTPQLRDELLPEKAAVVYIDCMRLLYLVDHWAGDVTTLREGLKLLLLAGARKREQMGRASLEILGQRFHRRNDYAARGSHFPECY